MGDWKKGCLHFHTIWSDGRSLPEIALHTLKNVLKYDFAVITDHNIFPAGELDFPVTAEYDTWPPLFSGKELERSQQILPDSIVTRQLGIRKFVRLKSFDTLKKEWDSQGEFLLLGGCENSAGHLGDSYHEFHLNLLNCRRTVTPAEYGNTPAETLRKNVRKSLAAAAEEDREVLLMLNHPFWRYWDIDPRWVLDNPEFQLLEICNNTHGMEVHAEKAVNSPEKYWDFILSHRIIRGEKPIYGTATDDAHFYDPEHIHNYCGCNHGWVMVNCPGEMTEEKLISALKAGDFYATCGVEFEKIHFDRRTRTLSVALKALPGTKYQIRFIVTRRNFSRKLETFTYQDKNPLYNREIPVIDDSFGQCVKSVDGIEASCTMDEDDLYIRAEAVSDTPGELQDIFYPSTLKAWTQPFF